VLKRAYVDLGRRTGRTLLAALGVMVGVAAVVGVLGISATASNQLLLSIDDLQDVLTVTPAGPDVGSNPTGGLPAYALPKAGALRPVLSVAAVTRVNGWTATRNERVPPGQTGGIDVLAVSGDLPRTIGVQLEAGRMLAEHEQLPVAVVGNRAAAHFGLLSGFPYQKLWVGDRWVIVVGVLASAPAWVDVDDGVLIGYDYARAVGAVKSGLSAMYVRTAPGTSSAVAGILPATADPEAPLEAIVDRPAAVVAAEAAARKALNSLYLALAAIGIVISGVGIANTLTVAVVERRAEIGLRRALGATRGTIAGQFVLEGALIAASGGIAGVMVGVWATLVYALHVRAPVALPLELMVAASAGAVLVGVLASLHPSWRAASLPPSDALRLVA
jgi:putative ABC transport system permease protein